MVDFTFFERQFDDVMRAAVRSRFDPHLGADGTHFTRSIHVRLQRRASSLIGALPRRWRRTRDGAPARAVEHWTLRAVHRR